MIERPKILVVGAGLIGEKHIEIAAQKGALCAIVEPLPAGAELARRYGVHHYVDLSTALAKEQVDGAIIATPNQLHFDHAKICIDRGIACLIEKPLTDTVESAKKIGCIVANCRCSCAGWPSPPPQSADCAC